MAGNSEHRQKRKTIAGDEAENLDVHSYLANSGLGLRIRNQWSSKENNMTVFEQF